MRISRLDLIRFGRFTETRLELPASPSDFHIIFGANEAGKSTALSAVENLLFGVPHNSPYNFLHDYGLMRIGAVLQSKEHSLEVRRRKGNKDTLLTADDLPMPGGERALAPFLAGADQAFFTRMFSLDHERLREGGREILQAQDEVGQTLFSAGAGLTGLRDCLKALDEEADGLWASRRATGRKYYQVLDRLEAAEKILRERTVTANKWQETKRAYDDARERYEILEKESEENSAEQRRLSRVRRVYQNVSKITALEEETKELGEVAPMAEDARARLDNAKRQQESTGTRIATLKEQLENEQNGREALVCDDALLLREDEIQQFHKRRIEIQKEKSDLPNRRAELASAEADLRRLAGELEWQAEAVADLTDRIPSRAKVASVRTLSNLRGERLSGVETARSSVEEAGWKIAELVKEIDRMGVPQDVSRLAALLKVARETSDIATQSSVAELTIGEAVAAIGRRLGMMRPQVADETTLLSMHVPARDLVQAHRDRERDVAQDLQKCRDSIRTTERDLAKHRKDHDRLTSSEHAITHDNLIRARARRDAGWSLVRRIHIAGDTVSEAEIATFAAAGADLPASYEESVGAADHLADLRFDNAKAAAEIVSASRRISEQCERLEELRAQEKALGESEGLLAQAWRTLWSQAPFEPLGADEMAEWLGYRDEVAEAVERRAATERQLTTLRRQEAGAKAAVLAELAALVGDTRALTDQKLRVVLEFAAGIQSRHEKHAADRRQIEQQLRKTEAEAERKTETLKIKEAAWTDWQSKWSTEIERLGLGTDIAFEAAAAQLDIIDQMREVAKVVDQLRNERIAKMERDIDRFTDDVETFVGAVAPDLAKGDLDNAILELERRFEDTKRIRQQQKLKDEAIASLLKRIEDCEDSAREACETIRQLQNAAGVDDVDRLDAAIMKSDRLRLLRGEIVRVTDLLVRDGDGLPLTELRRECEGADIDQIVAREEILAQEIKESRNRLAEAAELRTHARGAFDAIGGDDGAAQAAAMRQAALAEMREVAAQYVRVRTAATLLQWAIDRYRRDKQAPLLKRAGEIFALLTGNAFASLRVEFDDHDRAQLAGLRGDGTLVRVNGMSMGTADQLYLALRVASIEDYLDRATPLPFLADDLFINFDDKRSAAGLEVLGQLARKTQVLFFTHHQHLVEIARATLGSSVKVHSLHQDQVTFAA